MPILVLIAGLWVVMLFGIWLLGFVAAMRGSSRPLWSYEIMQAGLILALTVGLLKLLYHDVRLLTKPGVGAGREAIIEMDERVARAAGTDANVGLFRLGLVRVITGSVLAVIAGWLLWLTVSPVPLAPPPPTPVQAVVPFAGDLHDAKAGLPVGERALVARHIEQGVSLGERQRQLLDDALREVGRALIERASWDPALTPGTRAPGGNAINPLTADEVTRRLPRLRDDAPPEQIIGGPARLSLKHGCWILTWQSGGDRFVIDVNPLIGPSDRARVLPPLRFEGDWVAYSRVERERTLGAVERFLTRLRDQGAAPDGEGTPGVVTTEQAGQLAHRLRQRPGPPRGAPPSRSSVRAVLRPDGVVEMTDPGGANVWIGRDGSPHTPSPEQRAAAAAAAALVRVPRQLAGNPVAAAALLLVAVASAVVGAVLARAARTPVPSGHRLPPAMTKILRAHRALSLVGLLVAAYLLASVVLDEPLARKAAGEPVYVLPALMVLGWWIWAGFYAPVMATQTPGGSMDAILGLPR